MDERLRQKGNLEMAQAAPGQAIIGDEPVRRSVPASMSRTNGRVTSLPQAKEPNMDLLQAYADSGPPAEAPAEKVTPHASLEHPMQEDAPAHEVAPSVDELAAAKADLDAMMHDENYVAKKRHAYNQMLARHIELSRSPDQAVAARNQKMHDMDALIHQMAKGAEFAPADQPAPAAAPAPARPVPVTRTVAPDVARREARYSAATQGGGGRRTEVTPLPPPASKTNNGITTGPVAPPASKTNNGITTGPVAPVRPSTTPAEMSPAARQQRAAEHARAADKAIAAGRPNPFMRIGGEVGAGTLEGLGDTAEGIGRAVVHPIQTAMDLPGNLARLPGQALNAVNPMSDMSAEERTRFAVPLVVGPKVLKAGGRVAGAVASKAGKAVSKALPPTLGEPGVPNSPALPTPRRAPGAQTIPAPPSPKAPPVYNYVKPTPEAPLKPPPGGPLQWQRKGSKPLAPAEAPAETKAPTPKSAKPKATPKPAETKATPKPAETKEVPANKLTKPAPVKKKRPKKADQDQ